MQRLLRAVVQLQFRGSGLIANVFRDSQLGCSVVTIAFCPIPLPHTHHLRLRGMSCSDSDSLVSSASSTTPLVSLSSSARHR